MVVLSIKPLASGDYFSGDGAVVARLLHLIPLCLSLLLLLIRVKIDSAAVLSSPVVALSVERCRIMYIEKIIHLHTDKPACLQ